MKKSFRDPVTNILKAWGYADSNGADLPRDEPADFNLQPGQWKLEGGQWAAYSPTVIPPSVSPRQARTALRQQGLFAAVQSAVDAADDAMKDAWEYSTAFERNSPFVIGMQTTLGWTDVQIDNLFILAATL